MAIARRKCAKTGDYPGVAGVVVALLCRPCAWIVVCGATQVQRYSALAVFPPGAGLALQHDVRQRRSRLSAAGAARPLASHFRDGGPRAAGPAPARGAKIAG